MSQAIVERKQRVMSAIQSAVRSANPVNAEVARNAIYAAMKRDSKLQQCSDQSIFDAVYGAVKLGLKVNDESGQAYMLPYGQQCQLIIGYRGMLSLAYKSKMIRKMQAFVVYDNDRFSYSLGTDPVINHEPVIKNDRGPMVYVYASAKLVDGEMVVEVMDREEIDAIRHRSRSGTRGPWVTDYTEMAKKTVIRRLCKILPIYDLQYAAGLDEQQDFGPIDNEPEKREVRYTEPQVIDSPIEDDLPDDDAAMLEAIDPGGE